MFQTLGPGSSTTSSTDKKPTVLGPKKTFRGSLKILKNKQQHNQNFKNSMLYKIQLEDEGKSKVIKKVFTFLAIAILIATSAYLLYPNFIKTESKNVDLKPIVSSDSSEQK